MAVWAEGSVLLPQFRVAVVLLFVSVSCFSNGELVDFTCFNLNPVLSFDTDSTYIGGYKGSPALTNAAVSFGRTFYTATGSGLPTSCSCIPAATDQGTPITRQHMNCPNGACSCSGSNPTCLYRIGAFYCQIDTGTTVEKITTITLNSDAEIIPERQTITVSRGEAVTLRVTTTLSPSPDWRWRRTSYTFNNWLPNWDGIDSPYLSQVTPADGGVYECHANKMRGRGVHAIFRLIVRDCANDTWGTPSTGCVNECPVCYNGGVCHDRTGKCICAPGFSGSNCQIANGRNVWGYGGTLRCRLAEGRHGTPCRGRLFCLQDPFGCACAAGYKGIGCDQECDEPNTFGPYCSQTCHCADGITCLIDTGECNDPSCRDDYCPQYCASGWKGRNCQVVTPCMPGHYGELCNQRCNCRDDQPCSEDTGECTNGCADGYIGASCNEDGSIAITYLGQTDKPNAGQPMTIQCVVVGNPLPDATDVILQGPDAQQFPFFSSRESTELNTYMRTNEYILTGESASDGIQLTCYVNLGSTPYYFTVDVYELPYLVSAPTSSATDSMSITVSWYPWTSTQGRGDGPIVRYDVQYRLKSDDDLNTLYNFVISPAYNTSTSVVVPGLQIDTEYDFVIVVVREGEGGAGPPSPKTTLGTTCSTPTEAPSIMLTTESGTELRLTWQYPAQSTWQCRSLRDIQVYIKEESASRYPSQPLVYNSDETEAVLGSLEPCTRYEGYITFNNRDGFDSPMSNTVGATTAETAPGPVNGLSVFEVSGRRYDQLGVVWHAPTENSCPVDGYIISHTLKNLYACSSGITPVTHSRTVTSAVTTVSLNDLKAYSLYSVSVVAMNSEGNSTARAQSISRGSSEPTETPESVTVVTKLQRSLSFSWSQPPCGGRGGIITGYTYKLTEIGLETIQSFTMDTSVIISDLIPFTFYTFQVSANTSAGAGPYTPGIIERTNEAEPTVPLGVSVQTVDAASIILAWLEPDPAHGIITHYNVRYWRLGDMGTMLFDVNIMQLMHLIVDLQTNMTYVVQVQAATSVGAGPWSKEVNITTAIGVPGPVQNLRLADITENAVTLVWSEPLNPKGKLLSYIVEFRILEKPHQPGFTAEDEYDRVEVEIMTFMKYNLEPGTQYEFRVSARNELYVGSPKVLEIYTKPQSEPPAPPKPTVYQDEATDTTVTIALPTLGAYYEYIQSFVVQVTKTSTPSVTKREALIPRHYENSADDYIAAELPKHGLPEKFVVGDSIVYGGYYNSPLQTGADYIIRVGSVTRGNEMDATVTFSEPLTVTVQKPEDTGKNANGPIIAVIILVAFVFVLVLIVVVMCVLWGRRNHDNASSRSQVAGTVELVLSEHTKARTGGTDSPGEANTDNDVYEDIGLPTWATKLEIKWENLIVEDVILGKGNFGEVRAGSVNIKGKVTKAAVKTLKDSASKIAADDFRAELQTMAKIKTHPNVVCLFGACLHEGIMYVALEYLPNGNLRDYLRNTRPKEQQAVAGSPLTSSNLLTFGADVARGMDHLSNTGIIHRDLAARNILLAEDLTAKVSDFGLSRGEDIYVQKSSTRIPTRWLAIESLTRRIYKTKSDVWSFGILLWEIATYGATPYPGIQSGELAHKLLDGYRMPKPENCAEEIYDLMLKCWEEKPSKRPNFRDIQEDLEQMNDTSDENMYLSPTIYKNFIIQYEFDDN